MTTTPALPRSPALTVDIIIEIDGGIVLIERRNVPIGSALPGGFVDYGETVEAAAVREAKEETNLTVTLRSLLGVYSDPARDSRQHTVSVVFVAAGHGELAAGDDAKHAMVVDVDSLPRDLCFDHSRILADYKSWRHDGGLPAPRVPLSAADRRSIADIAWQTLAATVASPISSVRASFRSGPLAEAGACVVSIRDKAGKLRGSMGSADTSGTLALAVETMTAAAAVSDVANPFHRRELNEVRLEISVLGPPRAIRGPHDLVIGVHGVLVERGEQRALHAPEVAVAAGWEPEQFLRETCRSAGLAADAWQQTGTRVLAFTTEIVVASND